MFISVSEHPHFIFEQVCIQLLTSALNVTLLAFAAERRAAAPLLVGARRRRRCRSISTTPTALSSKPTVRRTPRLRSNDGTDRQKYHRITLFVVHNP